MCIYCKIHFQYDCYFTSMTAMGDDILVIYSHVRPFVFNQESKFILVCNISHCENTITNSKSAKSQETGV